MIEVLDAEGNIRPDRGRVPNEEHWGHYRKAERNVPGLIRALYDEINNAVRETSPGKEVDSTALGAWILSRWDRKSEFDQYCGHRNVSSPLFGQVMWTYFYDRSDVWTTTETRYHGSRDKEERVYFLKG